MAIRDPTTDGFGVRLREAALGLSPGAQRVARFIDDHRAAALGASAADLAQRLGMSDATVVRAIQALGFGGMADFKHALADALAAAPPNPADAMRRTLQAAGLNDVQTAIDHTLDRQRDAVMAVGTPETRAQLRMAVAALHPAQRILVFGLGPSAALAAYVVTMLGRTGRSSRALTASGLGLADQLLDLTSQDALLVLAYGRGYQEVITLFAEAKRLAIPVILFTDSLDQPLAKSADVLVRAPRGRAQQVALHGATLVALEAVVLGLAALNGEQAVATLDHLNALRRTISGGRNDAG
jgi:DNA-binding MurR/RpiR family transcriptional regulator